jgi:hypothetical protein
MSLSTTPITRAHTNAWVERWSVWLNQGTLSGSFVKSA